MSANNYALICKIKDTWYIWDNLPAEEMMENDTLTIENATKSFNSLIKAIAWANKHSETEYGYQVNDLHKPKDGYKENLIF